RPWLASITTVLLFAVVALIVIGGLLGIVAKQAVDLSDVLMPALEEGKAEETFRWVGPWVQEHVPSLAQFVPERKVMVEEINQAISAASGFLMKNLSKAGTGAVAFILKSFVMLYAMYFFLIDGRSILRQTRNLLPLSEREKDRVFDRFVSVTRATLKGSLLIGFLQGGLCGLALWAVGIEGWAFLAVIMFALSVIQGVGPPIVWLPALLVAYSRGQVVESIVAAVWCGAVVGSLDNLLRPHLVGKDAKMPDLLILVGTLGGIALFGLVGLILGPIICALFLTVWDIYRVAFREALNQGTSRIVSSPD
ncbi:MAG: AI-2E family transporter, partial [Verrucomicrobiales bacterium]